jgi:uncharacterized protein YggE
MKKKLFAIVLVLTLLGTMAACVPNPYVSLPTVNVSGKGEVRLVPDLAYVYIGVKTQAENVAEALSQNSNQAQQVSEVLKGLGVEDKDIQTTAFNVYPQQEYGPNGETLRTVYVVENTVFVTVRKLDQLGQMLDQVVRSGANSINGVSFDVEAREQHLAEARKLAIADAQKKAAEMADAAGVKLGALQSLNVYGSEVPVPVYDGKGGSAAQMSSPIAAGQLVLSAEASLSYLIK